MATSRQPSNAKPLIHQLADLSQLPAACGVMRELPQWVGWVYEQDATGKWSKAPHPVTDPLGRHASIYKPEDWCDFDRAVAAVKNGDVDGISFVLKPDSDISCIDADKALDRATHNIDPWMQRWLDRARSAYVEYSPGGYGVHIWGLGTGERRHTQRRLGGKGFRQGCQLEFYRHTGKIITVSGLQIGKANGLGNIDRVMDMMLQWAVQHPVKATAATAVYSPDSNLPGVVARMSISEREEAIREGAPDGTNRSEVFFGLIGYLSGIGRTADEIEEMIGAHPLGIGAKYIEEDRLRDQIDKCLEKYGRLHPTWSPPPGEEEEARAKHAELTRKGNGAATGTVPGGDSGNGAARVPLMITKVMRARLREELDYTDAEIDQMLPAEAWALLGGMSEQEPAPAPESVSTAGNGAAQADALDEALGRTEEQPQPAAPSPQPDFPESDELDEDSDADLDEESTSRVTLPDLYIFGDPDLRPVKRWRIEKLMPEIGVGFVAGQWGTYKTFVVNWMSMCLMTRTPFLHRSIKRTTGVCVVAAEDPEEERLRINAMMREHFPDMKRAPFRWYEELPKDLSGQPIPLLHRDTSLAVEALEGLIRKADASLQDEFGPECVAAVTFIDTVAAAAGFSIDMPESKPEVCMQLAKVCRTVAQRLQRFIVLVDHYGKDATSGIRGGSPKEADADLVLACLGKRSDDGRVSNMRVAIRKCRGGRSGQSFPFETREIDAGVDSDGDPIKTLTIVWKDASEQDEAGEEGTVPRSKRKSNTEKLDDPWDRGRTSVRPYSHLLKRALMESLSARGVRRHVDADPDGPCVRMVEKSVVYETFAAQLTIPEDIEVKHRSQFRERKFDEAVLRMSATEPRMVGTRHIDEVEYLWLMQQTLDDDLE
jgi:hypothetical protein